MGDYSTLVSELHNKSFNSEDMDKPKECKKDCSPTSQSL